MSPEQLEGKEADARSDIFAFGAVIYEMASGRKAFGGKTEASVIAAIMGTDPPSITTLRPTSPPALDRIVQRCLAKDPDERWQSIHDVVLELRDITAEQVLPSRAPKLWRSLFWAITALSLLIAGAAIYFGRHIKVEQLTMTLSLPAPENTILDSFAVSPPDGRNLAFTAIDASGKTRIWVRELNSLSAKPLDGTQGAMSPFWSPDSRFIAFFADGRLKKIEAVGGPLQTLADAADPMLSSFGGTWNGDGVILFPRTHADPIYRVPKASGKGTPATALDISRQEHGHRWPQFLPDGRHFLYYAWGGSGQQGMRVGSLDPREPVRVLDIRSKAIYAAGPDGLGYLLFIRDQTLLAQPFDAKRLELTGEPISLTQPVGNFSASENGVLVYVARGDYTQLTWFDRAGKRLGVVGPPGIQDCPALSPDEKRVAVSREGEVWIYELASGIGSRLTFHSGGIPIWSPDGGRIVYVSFPDGTWRLYQMVSSGAGEEELLLQTASREIWPAGWSHDGRFLLYGETDSKTHWDLWVLVNPLGQQAVRKSIPFLRTEFIEDFGQFSPDGKWIAHHSTESGRDEVYVRPFHPDSAGEPGGGDAPAGGKWQISRDGGVEPRWRADGRELFYYGIDGTMIAAPVKTGDVFESGTPEPLFWVRALGYLRYDVTADGKRFLVNTKIEEANSTFTVMLNWAARLER